MTKITVCFQSDHDVVEASFFDSLNSLAEQYGLHVHQYPYPAHDLQLQNQKLSHDEFVRKADEISSRIGPVKSDSTDDIRDLRDSR